MTEKNIIHLLMDWQTNLESSKEDGYFSVDDLLEHLTPEGVARLREYIVEIGGNPDRMYVSEYTISMDDIDGEPLETKMIFHFNPNGDNPVPDDHKH